MKIACLLAVLLASLSLVAAPPPPKYIKVNGVMKVNPAWRAYQQQPSPSFPYTPTGPPPPRNEHQALAVVSNFEDYENLNHAIVLHGGQEASMAESTEATVDLMQQPDLAERIGVAADEWVDQLGRVFAKYEVPMGLMNKLLELERFDALEFLVDDSGSMMLDTDVYAANGLRLTRWQEAQERLKAIMSVLAYVPTKEIRVCFLNRCDRISNDRTKLRQDPQQFIQSTHQQIDRIFARSAAGGTPFREKIEASLQQPGSIARYIFGDGEPNGSARDIERIKHMVANRPNPTENPLTFFSCSDDDQQVEWMKELEEISPFCAEFDDFQDEAEEVLGDQGVAFPFTRGFYMVGSLVAAMNPEDLDAMDEAVPFAKQTLDNMLGIQYSDQDYEYYFAMFLEAQRQRVGTSPADQVKRSMDWRPLLSEFKRVPSRNMIPQVQQFQQQLKAAVLGSGGSGVGIAYGGAPSYLGQQQTQPYHYPPSSPYGQTPQVGYPAGYPGAAPSSSQGPYPTGSQSYNYPPPSGYYPGGHSSGSGSKKFFKKFW